MRTGFRKLHFFSYSLQRTLHDFKNNRKMMLAVTNQSQPPPYAQKSQPAAFETHREQQKVTTHCGSEFENQIDFNEKAIELICDSTGRSEILG